MILYSVRSISEAYLIAKFNSDFDVEASYEVSPTACTCPAFHRRQSCKHQDILAKFIIREKVDTEWFYCRETDDWHNPLGLESMPRIETNVPAIAAPAGPSEVTFIDYDGLQAEPFKGIMSGKEYLGVDIQGEYSYTSDKPLMNAEYKQMQDDWDRAVLAADEPAEDPSLNNPTIPLPEPTFKRRI